MPDFGAIGLGGGAEKAAPDEGDDAATMACDSIIAAVKTGDTAALKEALQTFLDASKAPVEEPDESTSGLTA